MAQTSVDVDESLLGQAKEALGATSDSEAVSLALKHVLRRRRLAEILEHQGQIDLDLDQELLMELRKAQ